MDRSSTVMILGESWRFGNLPGRATTILNRLKPQSHIHDFGPGRAGAPQGFWGSGEKGYLFSGSWGALLIILGELRSKHILLGI